MAATVRPPAYRDTGTGRYWLAVTNLPFAGIGHLRGDRNGYAWLPTCYDRVR